ncbi:hypothetical protein F511_29719 [Dorcoceras hygrometricum]|uniref:Retrotransposon gag domain-containing protein n=1 Tax=Dorcoceras hygrometricum TaxID=472368 RepID=A0A2Z7ASC8_9LAMI|nr:hypothetical protein F511_29719 [Dorcoceras hygrometricum]
MTSRRGRGRTARRFAEESRASDSDEGIQQTIPLRRRERQAEVEDVTRQIGEMELVLARFQRMNPPKFLGTEGGLMTEGWLVQMEELFDTLEYVPEKRLKLAVLQLRDKAHRWWRGTSSILRESGAVITWESFCAVFRQEYCNARNYYIEI